MAPNLVQLPVELLACIACYCDASAAISFSEACRITRLASSDPSIFQHVLKHQQILWPHPIRDRETRASKRAETSKRIETFRAHLLLDFDAVAEVARKDIRTWSQFALANEKANALQGGLDRNLKDGRVKSLLRWAPHLVIYNHPFLTSAWLAYNLPWCLNGEAFETGRAFLYAATMMTVSKDGMEMLLQLDNSAQNHFQDSTRTGKTPSKMYRALGAFAFMLKARVRELWSVSSIRNSRSYIMPPTAMDIAFPASVTEQRLIPFQSDWDTWHEYYCRAFSKPEYLCSGHWTGYYSCLQESYILDNPMRYVQFWTHQLEDDSFFMGRGTDGGGRFSIAGKVLEDGVSLSMVKDHGYGDTCEWRCRMTPFGIFGSWHDDGGHQTKGAVWLWKEKWMKNETED